LQLNRDLLAKNTLELAVKERVLIHLLENPLRDLHGTGKVNFAVSQEGIAAAIGIYPTHASRAVSVLERRGLVEWKRRYVEGAQRKRMVYHLTPRGVSEAQKIKRHLERKKIVLRSLNGRARQMRLGEANAFLEREVKATYPTLRIIESLSGNMLDCRALAGKGGG